MLLSVIIPVYNGGKTILNCVNSIIKDFAGCQNNIEIIIVNDGSTDDTLSKIKQIKFQNLKVISKSNGGVSSARNAGIEVAIGRYIWFIDSDDTLPDFKGEYLIDKFESKPYIDMFLFGFKKRTNPNITKLVHNKHSVLLDHSGFIKEFNKIFSENEFNVPWNRIIKRSIIEKNQIRFDPQMSIGEDTVFNCTVIPYLQKIYIIDRPLYIYNLFLSGSSKNYNPLLRFNLLKLNSALKVLTESQGIDRKFFENKYERMNFSLLVNLIKKYDKYDDFREKFIYEILPKEKIRFLKLNWKAKVFYLLVKFNKTGYRIVKNNLNRNL